MLVRFAICLSLFVCLQAKSQERPNPTFKCDAQIRNHAIISGTTDVSDLIVRSEEKTISNDDTPAFMNGPTLVLTNADFHEIYKRSIRGSSLDNDFEVTFHIRMNADADGKMFAQPELRSTWKINGLTRNGKPLILDSYNRYDIYGMGATSEISGLTKYPLELSTYCYPTERLPFTQTFADYLKSKLGL